MIDRRTLAWTLMLASALLGAAHLYGDDSAVKTDESMLREAGLKPDGPGLLDYLRKQTLSDEDNVRLAQTVRRLGDRLYAVREQASNDLLAAERSALPFLRPALHDSDWEIRKRARRCLDAIETGPGLSRLESASRLLADRRPAGTAEVLLNYLPLSIDALKDLALKIVGFRTATQPAPRYLARQLSVSGCPQACLVRRPREPPRQSCW